MIDYHPQATVQDQGFGIAAQHLPHIFERFYRAAPQSSDEARSGGLGLAIAQAIMQAHGGEIRCQSELGKGSVFTLVFPTIRERLDGAVGEDELLRTSVAKAEETPARVADAAL